MYSVNVESKFETARSKSRTSKEPAGGRDASTPREDRFALLTAALCMTERLFVMLSSPGGPIGPPGVVEASLPAAGDMVDILDRGHS